MRKNFRATARQMTLFGLLKAGTIFMHNNRKYKFVSYSYDYIGEKEIIIQIWYDIKKEAYRLRVEDDIKDEILIILRDQQNIITTKQC